MLTNTQKIIKIICEEENIEYKLLSKNWIIELSKNNCKKYICGYKFPLNDHAMGEILDDKYATYEILKSNGIPVVEHNILYSINNTNEYAKKCNQIEVVKNYFENHNKKIVLKPNNGTCGKNVFMINEEIELTKYINQLLLNNFSICYSPYYEIVNEFRVIVLNNKIKLLYKKIKPQVKGDGVKSIRELLYDFNFRYFKNKLDDKKYDEILKKNECFEYCWKYNLSQGAIINLEKIDDYQQINEIVKKILKRIEIKFAAIDIIKTKDNRFYVLEINSGVMMDNLYELIKDKKIIKDIYRETIKTMMEEQL